MIKAVFFDLDGTLLPFDEDEFTKMYFALMCRRMAAFGYEPEQLAKTIWDGTRLMYKNNGEKTNCEVFWDHFFSVYGEEARDSVKDFDEFYTNEFMQTRSICKENPEARKIVDFCRENVKYTVLSTNPIFPLVGTHSRMSFVGLRPDDFDFVTAYENSRHSKPNPEYFFDLLKRFSLSPDEVILFGNNDYEDGECALGAGIRCYLVGDHIIRTGKATHSFPVIAIEDVIHTIQAELSGENRVEI